MAWTLSGAGLVAPASYSASGNVNTLDDYEEGKWVVVGSGTSGAITWHASYNEAKYIKIGGLVHNGGLLSSASSTAAGNLSFSLPFQVGGGEGASSSHGIEPYRLNFTAGRQMIARVEGNVSVFNIVEMISGTGGANPNGEPNIIDGSDWTATSTALRWGFAYSAA